MLPSLRPALFASPATPSSMAQWREHVLGRILALLLVLGCVAALPSAVVALRAGQWFVPLVDLLALGWLGLILRPGRFSLRTRTWHFLALLYLFALSLLLSVGAVAQIFLLACPVMAALLLGKRPAVAALLLTSLSLPTLGYLADLELRVIGFEQDALIKWLLVGLNFSLVNAALTLSSAVLIDGLQLSLQRQEASSRSLAEEQARLQAANEELRLISAAVAHLNDIVVIIEAALRDTLGRRIVFVNAALTRRTGYSPTEAIGQTLQLFQGPKTSTTEMERLRAALDSESALETELMAYAKDGEAFWLELELNPIYAENGKCSHFVMILRDIGERKQAEEDIHRLAYFDSLTGLPNRRLLHDRLGQSLMAAKRSGMMGAAIYLDLDNFKHVNDARGHPTGDALLAQVAQRLCATVREEDTVARLGGDEFVLLLPRLDQDVAHAGRLALQVAEKVLACLAQPFELAGQHYHSGGSLGVTLFPRPGQSADMVLREADMAMYRAKSAGRQRIVFFQAQMQAEIEERLAIQHQLELAIAQRQLALYLQPQVDAAGMALGAELLLRWQHPVLGPVPPGRFIPIAEESSLILRLGNWVLQEGCRTLVQLAEAGRPLPLSINVSPQQFHEADFVAQVKAALQDSGARADYLILELTEGLLIRNLDDTSAKMRELAALGLRFSIDDFGTGYSSLAYLKRLPLQELKIDRSFVQDAEASRDSAIIELILSMAEHLALRVVAEGVESEAQAAFLRTHGCHAMQGYLFARPMPLADWLALPAGHCFLSAASSSNGRTDSGSARAAD